MIREEKVYELANQYGTPLYIFDLDVFCERAKMVADAFGEKVGCCYSVKANPFLVRYLPETFCNIEVCSPGELTICEMSGTDLRKVIYSGVNKGAEDIRRAIDDGADVLTAESMRHVELIQEAAWKINTKVDVLLRLTAGSQFGMDASEIKDVLIHQDRYPSLRFTGIHFFSGTQKKKAEKIGRELAKLDAFMQELSVECGCSLRRVEYGTGLYVDYFGEDSRESADKILGEIAPMITAFGEKYDLTVEMGRFFAAPCGVHVTRIEDVKTNNGHTYAICDSGLNQLKYDGQLKGMQTPDVRILNRKTDSLTEGVVVCGSLCTTGDVLLNNFCVGMPHVGDLLAFYDTGAYSVSEGMAVFLSRELPAVIICSEDKGAILARKHIETCYLNME